MRVEEAMSKNPSLRWLFVHLPIDPDSSDLPNVKALPHFASSMLVAAGGIAGSLARAWIGTMLPHQNPSWPWSTLTVNTAGSGLLAFMLITMIERFPRARIPLPLIGTGLIGGFTTFSTFAVDFVQMSHGGHLLLGAGYVITTLFATALAAFFGLTFARAIHRLADREGFLRRVHHAMHRDSELSSG